MSGPEYRLTWIDAPASAASYETLGRALDSVRSRYPDAAWKTVEHETFAWADEAAAVRWDTPVAMIRRV